MTVENYQKEIDKRNTAKINELLQEMPYFVKDFFNARRTNTTTRTRLVYAYDIRKFFNWVNDNSPEISHLKIKNITEKEIQQITARDIEDFVSYLISSEENANNSAGVVRKLSSLSSFFSYLVKHEYINKNPCDFVDKPKVHDIEIIKLTPEESNTLLDTILYGSKSFSWKQEDYLKKTRIRDYTMIFLMLTTGMRVSELVGINCSDIYLKEFRIVIRRKGGNVANIYLSDEACDIVSDYLNYRKEMNIDENNDALFLSMQKGRIGVQAVENIVKKYAKAAGIDKKITPHKLRKTYGTNLYQETGDIYLVASSLGHSSVATTTKHYAAQDEINKIEARNKISLKTNNKSS